jgi:HK97 family phage prohead protease
VNFTTPLEFKGDAAGVFSGYGARFHTVDLGGDVLQPGAFLDSLSAIKARGAPLPLLWSHDKAKPIGRFDTLHEDSAGLFVEGKLTLASQAAKEAYALLRDRAVSGLSIGYSIPDGGAQYKDGVCLLRKVDLHEISLVAVPMHPDARVTSVKSISDCEHPRDLERLLRQQLGLSSRKAVAAASALWPLFGDRHGHDPDELSDEQIAVLVKGFKSMNRILEPNRKA